MAVRRLALEQPASFSFTPANAAWCAGEIAKYPAGRQASAVIPLLWKAQAQSGYWLPKPAIECVAAMLGMPYIRVLEVATFYSMFNLEPVGRYFIQLCGTTPCMLRGSNDIRAVCEKRVGEQRRPTQDGLFAWAEVECLGACCNAPMVQINDVYYEDLDASSFGKLLDDLAAGRPVKTGSQAKRVSSEPMPGPVTTLMEASLFDGSVVGAWKGKFAERATAAAVRAMLGLADRSRILDLLDDMLAGKTASVLERFASLHLAGAEPVQVLADLADAVHITTRMKVAGEAGAGEALSSDEKKRSAALAAQLSLNLLTRAWQMLLKGIEEAGRAPSPLAAAEMVLIRLCHTADLPTPDEIIRTLGGAVPVPRGNRAPAPDGHEPEQRAPLNEAPVAAPAAGSNAPGNEPQPCSFSDVVDLVSRYRDARLKLQLEDQVSLLRFEPGHIEIALLDGAPSGLAGELGEKLTKWTGRRWVVSVGRGQGEPPVGDVRRAAEAAKLADVKAHPAVAAVLAAFPEAEIKAVRPLPPRRKRSEQA